jgi:RNA polymerase primary sigma factor
MATRGSTIIEYMEDVMRRPRMTHAEVCQAARERDAGDPTAVNRIIEANLALVIGLAKRYGWSGVPIEDLIQSGNKALMRAAKRFDPDLGWQFSTLASGAIKRELSRAAFELPAIVHIPVYLKGVEGLTKAFTQTDAESFSAVDPDESCGLIDFIGASDDPEYAVIDDADERSAKLAAIDKAIDMLEGRARDVMRARIAGETLISIGNRYGVCRERIRQIEERSMRLIRVNAKKLLEV